MKKANHQLTKRLALLMSGVVLGMSLQVSLYARPKGKSEKIEWQSIERGRTQVTTDGAFDVLPDRTTDSALDRLPDVTTGSAYALVGADKQTVYEGQEEIINYTVEVGQITTSNMLEVELTYDEGQLTFIDAQIKLEGNVPIEQEVKEGRFYINFGTIRPQDFKETKKILNVQFKTSNKLKKDEEIHLYLSKCNVVAITEEDETTLHKLIDKPQVATVKVIEQETSLDINQDGKITIEDLSIAMKYYGLDEADVLWEQAKKCDVTRDGRVDLADLVAIKSKKET